MIGIDREPRGEDPLLLLKMALFFAAAAVAVVGMVTKRPWVISVAILILAVGFILRLFRPRQPQQPGASGPGEEGRAPDVPADPPPYDPGRSP